MWKFCRVRNHGSRKFMGTPLMKNEFLSLPLIIILFIFLSTGPQRIRYVTKNRDHLSRLGFKGILFKVFCTENFLLSRQEKRLIKKQFISSVLWYLSSLEILEIYKFDVPFCYFSFKNITFSHWNKESVEKEANEFPRITFIKDLRRFKQVTDFCQIGWGGGVGSYEWLQKQWTVPEGVMLYNSFTFLHFISYISLVKEWQIFVRRNPIFSCFRVHGKKF